MLKKLLTASLYTLAWCCLLLCITFGIAMGFFVFAIVAVPIFVALMETSAGDLYYTALTIFILLGASLIFLTEIQGDRIRLRTDMIFRGGAFLWAFTTIAFMFHIGVPERYYLEESPRKAEADRRSAAKREEKLAEGKKLQDEILKNFDRYVPHQPTQVDFSKQANGDYAVQVKSHGNLAATYRSDVRIHFLSADEDVPDLSKLESAPFEFRFKKGSIELEPGSHYLAEGEQAVTYVVDGAKFERFMQSSGDIIIVVSYRNFAKNDSLKYGNVFDAKMRKKISRRVRVEM